MHQGMAVYPEGYITSSIAKIDRIDNTIRVVFNEWNKDFRSVMLLCGFRWCPKSRSWQREITQYNGPLYDRMAEVGNRLLNAGIPILIQDEDIRHAAINAEYEPEQTRWIFANMQNAYFVIHWDKRRENFYNIARRIPGSSYNKQLRTIMVSIEHFQDVLDFASMYKFALDDNAKKLIAQARQLEEQRFVVAPAKPKENNSPQPSDVPQKLEVPEEVDIDESLRDND